MNGIKRSPILKLIFLFNFKSIFKKNTCGPILIGQGSIAYPKFWDQGFVVFKKNTKTIRFLHPCFKFSTDTALREQIELLQSGIYKLMEVHANPTNINFFYRWITRAPNGYWTHNTLPSMAPLHPFLIKKWHLSQSSHITVFFFF